MDRLSKELLERLATDKRLSDQQIQDYIDQELRLLAEDIARKTTK